jgi:hypothetical protein
MIKIDRTCGGREVTQVILMLALLGFGRRCILIREIVLGSLQIALASQHRFAGYFRMLFKDV